MRKLIEGCGIADKEIGSYHIGFVIGPCINAGGRLETAETALRLFMSTDEKSACALSEKLIELNARRKEMTEEGVKKACELCEKDYADDKVLVVYLGDLHESLAGIVAGRIRERYSKPAFVITDAEEGLKGSGRSIEAYHMFDKLCEVADILEKFGGHPMAAGLSLKRENLDELRKRLNEGCGLTEDDLKEKKGIDFIIPVSYITSGLIEEMDILKPFGQGNEKPVLADRELSATDIRILGKNKNVLKLRLIDKNGYFVGGIITAGMKVSLKGLVDNTAQLYDVLLEKPRKIICKNTKECIQSGVIYGQAYMVSEFARRMENELGYTLNRVLTGGFSKIIKDEIVCFAYEENLALDGLFKIYKFNESEK